MFNRYKILRGREITLEVLNKIFELDKFNFNEDSLIDSDRKLSWFNKNAEMTIAIMDLQENELVAYLMCFPITDDCYKKHIKGKITVKDIIEEDIVEFEKPGKYNMYIFSTVVAKQYRGKVLQDTVDFKVNNKRCLTIIIEQLIDILINLSSKGYIMNTITAEATKKKVSNYLKLLGIYKINKNGINNYIHSNMFNIQLLEEYPKYETLKILYKKS